jgi:hypothetical protein
MRGSLAVVVLGLSIVAPVAGAHAPAVATDAGD